MNEFYNRLASREYGLRLPTSDKDQIERYVARSGRDENNERVPFLRQVDFWAFSIATALALKLEPYSGASQQWGTVFIYTRQGILSNDLCSLLAIVATDRMGIQSPEIDDPGKIIELANRLACSGCPEVLKKLSSDQLRLTPLDRALSFARELLSKSRTDT